MSHTPTRCLWKTLALLALAQPGSAHRTGEQPESALATVRSEEDVPLELRVPRMDAAQAQLAHARRLKARSFRSQSDEDRRFWRSLAIEGYQAVRVFHPRERALAAEAAFRAGELLRADGCLEAAAVEFELARSLGPGTAFHARAQLELGHMARRKTELRVALDRYLSVASEATAAARHREQAWLWAGRCWWERGARSEARRAWMGVAERAHDPFLTLRAHDELTLAWVDEGDLQAAAGQLERCRVALSPILLEESERGEKLVDAFRRMRAREVLRVALERARTRDSYRESVQASERIVRETLDTTRRMFHR